MPFPSYRVGFLHKPPASAGMSAQPDSQIDHMTEPEHGFIFVTDRERQFQMVEKLQWVKKPAHCKLNMKRLKKGADP